MYVQLTEVCTDILTVARWRDVSLTGMSCPDKTLPLMAGRETLSGNDEMKRSTE